MVLSFGAGGLRTPFLTPSASCSKAGAELATRLSYDVPVKIARVIVAEVVADVAALLQRVQGLVTDHGSGALRRLRKGIRNLRVVLR